MSTSGLKELVEASARILFDNDLCHDLTDAIEDVVAEKASLKEKLLRRTYTDEDYLVLGKQFVEEFLTRARKRFLREEEDEKTADQKTDA